MSRIVKIPTGRFTATDFDLTKRDRDWLHNSGYEAAKEFLESWSFDRYLDQRVKRTG